MKDKDKEIKEALEIIKKPITVNSVEYKYFDLENYNKIVKVFDEFSFLLARVEPYIEEQQKIINKYKETLDKIKEYCKNKIEEQKNMTDFSKYYLENYDKAINIQHLSHSGVMLETIKSTTIKRYEDILELLEEIE